MKAIGLTAFGGPEVLETLERPMPEIGDGQVLLRVQAVSVNYADIQTRKGSYHAAGAAFPIIPGLDATGVIERVGSKVRRLKEGQRVIAFPHSGSYAEYVAVDENLAFQVPDAVDLRQASACPLVGLTAHMLLSRVARVNAGETVLIYAASGGVGTAAIQIARALGAGKVIGVVGSEEKKAAALKAGSDVALCHRSDDVVKLVDELGGADVILDSLGGRYTTDAMRMLSPYGRLAVFGNASGEYQAVDTRLLHASCRSVLGFSIGTTRKRRPELFAPSAQAVLGLMESGRLTIPVSRVLPLEQAAEAHRLLESGHNTGKIVLEV